MYTERRFQQSRSHAQRQRHNGNGMVVETRRYGLSSMLRTCWLLRENWCDGFWRLALCDRRSAAALLLEAGSKQHFSV